jgi:hypothetical protein
MTDFLISQYKVAENFQQHRGIGKLPPIFTIMWKTVS